MRVRLTAPDRETLARQAKEFNLDIGGGGPRRLPDGTVSVEAYVPEGQLGALEQAGGALEVIEDATAVGRERQKEVGEGDRFEGGTVPPRGLGRKE
jgi:hypothetical protein